MNQPFLAKKTEGQRFHYYVNMGLGVTKVKKSDASITGFTTGKAISVMGTGELCISVFNAGTIWQCTELFYVVDQLSETLSGISAIRALGLIPTIELVSIGDSTLQVLLSKCQHVLEGLGKYHT